jgi:hypothetical protein
MATFRKYAFPTQAEFEAFYQLSQPDATCVELGEIDNTYCVDLLWDDQPAPDWEQFETWPPPVGVHTFLGWDEQYGKDYTERDDLNNTLNED